MNRTQESPDLVLSPFEVSRIVTIGIIGLLFVFVAGYYCGKKSVSEDLVDRLQRDAFADRISSSLCTVQHVAGDATDEKKIH